MTKDNSCTCFPSSGQSVQDLEDGFVLREIRLVQADVDELYQPGAVEYEDRVPRYVHRLEVDLYMDAVVLHDGPVNVEQEREWYRVVLEELPGLLRLLSGDSHDACAPLPTR